MSIERILGFICGAGVVVLLFWAISRRFTTDGSRKTKYDERQQLTRGKGFRYALYTIFIYLAVMIVIDCMGFKLPFSNTLIYFTGVILSGLVLAGYCIMHDAYWGLNNNINYFIRFFIGIGLVNLIFGFIELKKGTMIIDGILQNSFINFEAGILIAGIGIMLLIKKSRDKKEESEDE